MHGHAPPARPQGASSAEVQAALASAFAGADITVTDDSASHAGHAAAGVGTHFSVRIVSPRFAGLSRVASHRLVYDALRPLIERGIHALVIDTATP